jgi:hypothetical protein
MTFLAPSIPFLPSSKVLTWGTDNRGNLAIPPDPVLLAASGRSAAITSADGDPQQHSSDSDSSDDDFLGSLAPAEELTRIMTPQLVPSLLEQGVHVVKAYAAPFHTVAVTAEGGIYTWGKVGAPAVMYRVAVVTVVAAAAAAAAAAAVHDLDQEPC